MYQLSHYVHVLYIRRTNERTYQYRRMITEKHVPFMKKKIRTGACRPPPSTKSGPCVSARRCRGRAPVACGRRRLPRSLPSAHLRIEIAVVRGLVIKTETLIGIVRGVVRVVSRVMAIVSALGHAVVDARRDRGPVPPCHPPPTPPVYTSGATCCQPRRLDRQNPIASLISAASSHCSTRVFQMALAIIRAQ